MTTTTTTALPKNKTGLFAGDTLQEVKLIRSQTSAVPTHRQTGSTNLFSASTEQMRASRNEVQSNYSNEAIKGARNGFRPSSIRRQKSRVKTAMAQHDNHYRDLKDLLTKDIIPSSPASARLKSEIDQLNSQLKIYGDLNKLLRLQNNPDIPPSTQSVLSYSTYRLSSASTNRTLSRLHQRYASTVTNAGMSDISLVAPSPPLGEQESKQDEMNDSLTHAYQIPQRSNVGSESMFSFDSPPLSTIKTRSTKPNQRSHGNKPILCPFYVMYFTNLAIQERPRSNSRISSSVSTRRQVNTPVSMTTNSPTDDSSVHTTSYYNHKRFSEKMAEFENENSSLLKDILRTTSWNHLQV